MTLLLRTKVSCSNLTRFLKHVRSATTDSGKYCAGQTVHGYTIEKVEEVSEFSLSAIHLRHNDTGTQHLHIAREDSNNVFGVALRTTPMDDTGVPHILEHTALCGSNKFPVRDPFFKMLNRSLSTFMNAFTASDWTMYPFSTQNRQDFENLLSVYLDSVFFPRLRETDFRQEGWRLENADLNDRSSPIVFKGVVFNEMKGVFSNSQSWFAQHNQNLLLPAHTYSTVYGGDPQCIPDLSWQQLRDFHASHYHPSNARFYTYGDMPLENHLQFISENVLDHFSKITTKTEVPLEPRWNEAREHEIGCAMDPMAADPNKQTTVAVSYLMADITDIYEAATLSILSALLVHSEKSPFYRALIEANIGSDFAPVLGFDGNTRVSTFSVGLQGIDEADVTKVKTIINETIDSVIETGFEQGQVDAILHGIELSQKHQSEKFGLHLGVSLLPSWIHEGDPIKAIKVNELVSHFKNCLHENPRYLQDKMVQYFKNNKHRLTLVMKPDDNFEAMRQQKEQQKLQAMTSALSEQQKQQLYDNGLELAELQMREEDLSCLPTLKIDDINKTTKLTETSSVQIGRTPVQLCEQPTNGVTYFRALSNMAGIPEQLKPYVSLFCSVVTKMGTQSMDYKEMSQKIDLKTGGLNASVHVATDPHQLHSYEQAVLFSSYCLHQNSSDMFDLWTDIFHNVQLSDSQRLSTLTRMCAAELAHSLSGAGHTYAMSHAASSLSAAADLKENMSGLTQVALMKRIAEGDDLSEVTDHLCQIASIILSADSMRCAVNARVEDMHSAVATAKEFITSLPENTRDQTDIYTQCKQYQPASSHTHFELPFQVNFVARSVLTVPYCHPDFAGLRILAKLMSSKFLHREIREKGGAYGGGAVAGTSGIFNFFSYRDPHCEQTLQAFDNSIQWAANGGFSQQDLHEAKLAIFSQVDMPVGPGNKAMSQFLNGIDDTLQQNHRDELFAVSRDSAVELAQRYLLPKHLMSSVSLLGPNNPTLAQQTEWTIRSQL